jgi:hypothetical protein
LRKERVVLTLIIGIILLSVWSEPIDAQYDDFPIGMNLTYVVFTAIPGHDYEVQNVYEFIQWIDIDNLIVEYEIDTVSQTKPFNEICLPGPDHPPLWMDVSTWSIGDRIEISGREFPIIMMEDAFTGASGTHECFRLETIVQANDRQNGTTFWYHAELGLLLDYLRTDEVISTYELIKMSSTFVIGGNFNPYNPPTFTVPQPTTTIPPDTTSTTTTTTTPPPQTTTSGTTSPTPRADEAPIDLTETFVIGIAIELFVILIFVRSRMK